MNETELHKEIREHVNSRLGTLETRTENVEVAFNTFRGEMAGRLNTQDKLLADIHKFVRAKAPSLYCTRKKLKVLPVLIMVVTIGIAAAYHWYMGDFFTWVWDVKAS